ncbi:MAG: preprotein translocase subunit SecA [Pelagibacterales bacterium]|nr:preprotein translocase subunit SecA [Pelagibacterales bacterium]
MLNIAQIIGKFVKNSSQREIGRLKIIVKKINDWEPKIKKISDESFITKTVEFKERVKNGAQLDDVLPEAFAYVREAARRTLGERHFDVQLMGGIILHEGKIAEMKTGEGKTLVSTLPAYLNALMGNGVHIVTVNDYLAKRDSAWMGKIFNFLGLSVGCITNELEDDERKKSYNCDITYGTNNEFGFDYLRDNMKYNIDQMVQRNHFFCIVDEVDSILIDEARTPLVISGATEDKSDQYFVSNKFIKQLEKSDYEADEKDKNVMLSEKGIDKIEQLSKTYGILKNNNFYDPQNINLVHHINQALRANLLFLKDTDYIVVDNKVQIIDEFTGRVLEGRRFSDGLHQALEAKENVEIQSENQTLASITYQNYFRLYNKLSGMTGTALTEAEEFYDIYKLKTISIPTNRLMVRTDLNDQIFRTEKEKYNAIVNKIEECNKTNQPVLVGTTSIEKSEKISKLLEEKKISHNVLNAKNHQHEAQIIADAGTLEATTIATNMAGRGTDIQLGGINIAQINQKINFYKKRMRLLKKVDCLLLEQKDMKVEE